MAEEIISRALKIRNKRGLHARASVKFVRAAAQFDAEIEVEKDGVKASGKSVLDLLMLAAAPGTIITVRATGRQAKEAVQALAALVSGRFGEGE